MDCGTVMAPVKTQLYAEDPAGQAIDFMCDKHMGLVPVVDHKNTFVGMISGDRLMHLMLPGSLMAMQGKKRVSYLNESREEFQERLDALRARPLGELVDRINLNVVKKNTPLSDALMLISEKQFVVPVVDDDDKLLGAISFFTILHWIKKGY
ncbi:MAG: CBS domain-containing protein [Bacteriovoracaceae bacterium]|nr:CBS domain-containing protein [Bacteriovoracaceae bacterium]